MYTAPGKPPLATTLVTVLMTTIMTTSFHCTCWTLHRRCRDLSQHHVRRECSEADKTFPAAYEGGTSKCIPSFTLLPPSTPSNKIIKTSSRRQSTLRLKFNLGPLLVRIPLIRLLPHHLHNPLPTHRLDRLNETIILVQRLDIVAAADGFAVDEDVGDGAAAG